MAWGVPGERDECVCVCQCVKALVYYDVQTCHLDLQNDKGDAALHLAARWGYEGIIQVLLENGADAHLPNRTSASPLQCALNAKVSLAELTHTRTHTHARQQERQTFPCGPPGWLPW